MPSLAPGSAASAFSQACPSSGVVLAMAINIWSMKIPKWIGATTATDSDQPTVADHPDAMRAAVTAQTMGAAWCRLPHSSSCPDDGAYVVERHRFAVSPDRRPQYLWNLPRPRDMTAPVSIHCEHLTLNPQPRSVLPAQRLWRHLDRHTAICPDRRMPRAVSLFVAAVVGSAFQLAMSV